MQSAASVYVGDWLLEYVGGGLQVPVLIRKIRQNIFYALPITGYKTGHYTPVPEWRGIDDNQKH